MIWKFNLLIFYFKARRLYSINIDLEGCIRSMQLQPGILEPSQHLPEDTGKDGRSQDLPDAH